MTNCIHQQPFSSTHHICLNIEDILHNGTVPKETCNTCPYSTPVPIRGAGDVVANILEKTGIASAVKYLVGGDCGCDGRQEFLNTMWKSKTIDNGKWYVAVTTAPRPNPTLTMCLESVIKAGWSPTVFAEPGSITIPNITYIQNKLRLGVWYNFLQSLQWGLDNTNAEFFLTVQDDSLFHPDSRTFVEGALWPTRTTGFISLYTPKHYSMDKSRNNKPLGINRIKTNCLWGACALVFHRVVVEAILKHKITKLWKGVPPQSKTPAERKAVMDRRHTNPETVQNSDTAIGKIMNALNMEMYFIDPSPVSHIATHSAIGHGDNKGRRNCIRCADHSKPLFDQVFPGTVKENSNG